MSSQPAKPIEQIVHEVGRFPLDGFVFVQECLGNAAEQVHGRMSRDQVAVVKWMAKQELTPEDLTYQYHSGQLSPEITHAVERIGGPDRMNRHVTGQQLCRAIRDVALERWGLMARTVLARWNIACTEDIGAIIFALVDNGWLQRQPTDTLDDFDHVFSFVEAFDRSYELDVSRF